MARYRRVVVASVTDGPVAWLSMARFSAPTKVLAGLGVVGVIGAYAIVLDLGLNAGLIHEGVRIGHLDVGRMTEIEARRMVDRAGLEMMQSPVSFTTDGLPIYAWTPEELGWDHRPTLMSELAMNVGRRAELLASLGDRVKAWVKGVKIRWERPNPWIVRRTVKEVAADGLEAGLTIDKARMQYLIRKAIWSWPRAPVYEIPLKD